MHRIPSPGLRGVLLTLAAASALGLGLGLWTGCASLKVSSSRKPAVEVSVKEALYLPLPVLADSVDSLLSRTGWGEGRFSRELRKEIAFQFNRKGVPIVEDSAQAKAILNLSISEYGEGGSGASRLVTAAKLVTPAGARDILFKKEPGGAAQAPERDDPTVDNIRLIAASLVEGARKDPNRKKPRPTSNEYVPQMMILF